MNRIRSLTFFALFAAIILLFAFTPFGFIQLVVLKATLIHIPVIIGSLVLGWRYGAALGALFGLTSLINNTVSPSLLSFVFSPFIPITGTTHGSLWALVTCFGPRILLGILPALFFQLLRQRAFFWRFPSISFFSIAFLTTFIHTLCVLSLMGTVFAQAYRAARSISPNFPIFNALVSLLFVNGIPEALVAGLVAAALLPLLARRKVGILDIYR